jgi:heptosyltransferase-1/heptosyltransferase-2
MAWPAIDLAKRTYPDAKTVVFIPPKPREIISAAFAGTDVSPYSSTSIYSGFLNRGYDIAISNTITAFYLASEINAFLIARHSYGFRYPDEKQGSRLFNGSVSISDRMHDIDQNILLTAMAFGIPPSSIKTPLSSTPKSDFLNKPKAPAGATVIIHPGVETGYDYKLWPIDRYVKLCRRLADAKYQVKVLIGPSDTRFCPAFACLENVTFLEKLPGSRVIDEINKAALFIGNDSGPAHLAAFLGTPGITLIGPVDPLKTEPRGPFSRTIQNPAPCSPCYFKTQNCPDNICMKSITPEQVLAEAGRFICL